MMLVPRESDTVHNDECMYSFATPFSPDGLFVNLHTWRGFSRKFIDEDPQGSVYAHLQFREVAVPSEISKLGVGGPGGFAQTRVEKQVSVYFKSSNSELELADPTLDGNLRECAQAVAEHKGARRQEEVRAWEMDADERPVSKYASSLVQEPAKPISMDPTSWECGLTGSRENLWLNLSDGFIGSGRRNFDGTGGTNGAMDHFMQMKAMGKEYPLVVKLGTLSPDSQPDVFSYGSDEEGMVVDPHLTTHLAHWSIDIACMRKSEKTLAEMEVDLNKDFAFEKILEAGDSLEKVTGPGLLGLANLGNTCYLNSVCQLVVRVEEVGAKYGEESVLRTWGKSVTDPHFQGLFEMAKLVCGLLGGNDSGESITPFSFRRVFTRSHAEFASGRQQDAAEFLLHFLKELGRCEFAANHTSSLDNLFTFSIEDRLECDGLVKYSTRRETVLAVQVQPDEEGEKSLKKTRPNESNSTQFHTCLSSMLSPHKLEGFRSPLSGAVSEGALKSSAIESMPPYLIVSVNRYYFTPSFEAAKLDCAVQMPISLDLERFRARGRQTGEAPFPENDSDLTEQGFLVQLTSMGFDPVLAKQACIATKNVSMEAALQWVLENPEGVPGSPEVEMLVAMGFSESQARAALSATGGSMERAADWLFSRPVESSACSDGPGKYELVGFVSHLGKSTSVGHYVCHIRKGDEWVLFNDQHVAKSKHPPLDYGYLYLYKRVE